MPIYEYHCQDCGKKFEMLRSMGEADAPVNCQNCASANTSRTLSVFFARGGGKVVAGGNPGCASCSSGSCASCRVN